MEGLKKSSAKILPIGTVLFTSRAGIGNTAILAKEGTTNQGFQSIIPKENILDSYFIFSRTIELKRYGEISGAGSTFIEISGKQMTKMPIFVPNIIEQKVIGIFFKHIDSLLALHQRNIEQVKELKHGYLQQLFPKNNELFPSVRFANFNGEWELRKLGELAKWTRGNGLSKSVLNKKGIGAEVIHYADLYKFGATINNVVNWSDSDQGTLIPLNSLLFPMSDVTSFGLARTSTINRLGVKASGDTLIATITSKENSQFISYQINASPKNILSLVTGTTVRHISSQNLSSLIIKLPSICEQTQIGNFFKQLDHIITIHQQKIDKLNHLKKAYLQNMFI